MFCRQCGTQLREGAKFCLQCGTPVMVQQTNTAQPRQAGPQHVNTAPPRQAPPQQSVQQQAPVRQQQTVQQQASIRQQKTVQQQAPIRQPQPVQQQAPIGQPQAVQQAVGSEAINTMTRGAGALMNGSIPGAGLLGANAAPTSGGMFSFDISGSSGGALGEEMTVLAPLKALTGILGRIVSGFKNIGKNPMALIPVIVLALMWIVLFILRRVNLGNNIVARFFSWLSYGWSTSNRTLPGVVGTMIGRGTLALGFSSLLTGGISFIKTGIQRLKGGESKNDQIPAQTFKTDGIAWALAGLGAALVLNRFIAGAPTWTGAMAVIAAAVMSLEAFGNSHSWLYSVAASLTSRIGANGIRTANNGNIRMLMTAFTAGFSIMILFSGGNSLFGIIVKKAWIFKQIISAAPLVTGIIAMAAGVIMVIVSNKKPAAAGAGIKQ